MISVIERKTHIPSTVRAMLSAISFCNFTFSLTHLPRTDILPSRYLLTSSSTARITTVLHSGNCEPTDRCGREVTSVRKSAGKAWLCLTCEVPLEKQPCLVGKRCLSIDQLCTETSYEIWKCLCISLLVVAVDTSYAYVLIKFEDVLQLLDLLRTQNSSCLTIIFRRAASLEA